MQIKEFEAQTIKECLQQVRSALGAEAVILETRKFRKGGLFGFGSRDAVAIVAATGITVNSDPRRGRQEAPRSKPEPVEAPARPERSREVEAAPAQEMPGYTGRATARVAARGVYGTKAPEPVSRSQSVERRADEAAETLASIGAERGAATKISEIRSGVAALAQPARSSDPVASVEHAPKAQRPRPVADDGEQFRFLERTIGEIRECLQALQQEQKASHDRTVSAVVSAVAPAVTAVNAAGLVAIADEPQSRFAEIITTMRQMGVSDDLTQVLVSQLPDMGAWSEQAQQALAVSAMKELIGRRISSRGPIELTPGRLKAVALVGPTGVGKTTTIAKLAAHFALMQGKRVALLTMDTYRIAAVEQLKTYSQIIGLPVSVAYHHGEIPPLIAQYADYDLMLIDTAGRSQKHIMQIGELKSLLDAVNCETHLVLSAPIKEQDMVEAARRFSAARVDRIIFSKLDETNSYGTLLNVADQTGIPLSYLTTGQKVPEDLEVANGSKLASLILG